MSATMELADDRLDTLAARCQEWPDLTDEQVEAIVDADEELVGTPPQGIYARAVVTGLAVDDEMEGTTRLADAPAPAYGLEEVESYDTALNIFCDPNTLHQHPEAGKLPQLPKEEVDAIADSMRAHGFDRAFPIKLARDGQAIIDGDGRKRAAVLAGLPTVPCVMIAEGEDEQEAILAAVILRKHLTDNQRAVIAYRYQQRLVEVRNIEKGQQAARARQGNDLSESDKSSPQNSRKEAAIKFSVPENKLKLLKRIDEYEKAQKVKPEKSLLDQVLAGKERLTSKSDPIEMEKKAKDKAASVARIDRAKSLPNIPAIQHGSPEAVMRSQFLGDDSKPKIDLLVIDACDQETVAALLKLGTSAFAEKFGIFVLVDHKNEAEVEKVMRDANHHPIRLIWDFADNQELPPNGGKHMAIFWAGTRDLRQRRGGDVIRCSRDLVKKDRPAELWKELLDLAALSSDCVFFPTARDATPVVTAEIIQCRVIAAFDTKEAYLAARDKYDLQSNPAKWFALHDNFPKQADEPVAHEVKQDEEKEASNVTV